MRASLSQYSTSASATKQIPSRGQMIEEKVVRESDSNNEEEWFAGPLRTKSSGSTVVRSSNHLRETWDYESRQSIGSRVAA